MATKKKSKKKVPPTFQEAALAHDIASSHLPPAKDITEEVIQRAIVRRHPTKNVYAVQCPCPDCEARFVLSRRGDVTTYNIAQYHIHLQEIHKIFLPKPLLVME